MKLSPIEAMIDDFYRFTLRFDLFVIPETEWPWEDVRNFAAYISQVDEEMYPIGGAK